MSYVYKYPRPMVTVDAVVFALDEDALDVLLVRRARDPYRGRWALPGGFVNIDETLEEAVERELEEETGLAGVSFYPLKAYSDPDRDPRGRNISFAFLALTLSFEGDIKAGDDAASARWFPASDLPDLAFDHGRIIEDAVVRLRELVLTSDILVSVLPAPIPLSMLERAMELVFEGPVDMPRLLEHLLAAGLLLPAGKAENGEPLFSPPAD